MALAIANSSIASTAKGGSVGVGLLLVLLLLVGILLPSGGSQI